MENPTGKLSLCFRKKTNGKSYLAKQYYKLPLQIMPIFYQDDDGTAFAYMLNPSGGILQHDRLYTEILMEQGSSALVTTPACTRFYKMDDGYAVLENRIEMQSGSVLEYIPEHNVPFAGSRTHQTTEFHLDKQATLISFDMTVPGRVSRDEIFDYDYFESKTKIFVDGKLTAYDSMHIEPGKTDLTSIGMIECKGANATIYVYKDKMSEEVIDAVRTYYKRDEKENAGDQSGSAVMDEKENAGDQSAPAATNVRIGASMVTDSLMIVRLLSEDILEIRKAMLDIWDIIRRNLLGKPAVRIRKY